MNGILFNIQRFSTMDGPGIRTTAFLKGCNVRCIWCHNPESIDAGKILKFYRGKCVNCGSCARVCPEEAVRMSGGLRTYDPGKCSQCGKCIEVCLYGALEMVGNRYTPRELTEILLRDRDYYDESGGGVTFSGGEPLLQVDFLVEVLEILKEQGVHTAIDSALYVGWSQIQKILPFSDLFLLDLKGMNREMHFANTGVFPELIHNNSRRLAMTGKMIIVRMPLIRGLNDDLEEIRATAEFIRDWPNLAGVELLSYHSLGADKAAFFPGMKTQPVFNPPEPEFLEQAVSIFEKSHIRVL